MQTGPELIQRYVQTLPNQPGVYRMLDAKGAVLYVGKARDLKNRVGNYTSLAGKNNRLARMILQTAAMEFVTTRNEAEALLLEANLIKKLEPRYNILLRDDKSFPFLRMTEHEFPRICKYRGAREDKGDYFGPFASAGEVDKVIKQLQKAFLLRPCSDSMFDSRSRPCLQYQIKRCSAPCVDYISARDYAASLQQAKRFLKGENREIQDQLLAQMQAASAAEDFERAAELRDRLRALSQIQNQQALAFPHIKQADVIAITSDKGFACVQVFFFRDGQNFGNLSHFLRHDAEQSEAEILAAFLPQFYQQHRPPHDLLVSVEPTEKALLEEALGVQIHQPRRGDKYEAVQQASQNARQALARHLETRLSNEALMEKLVELFGLAAVPERIEVYDNSHISGSHAVGAMIVAGAEGFQKNHYRKFTIKDAATDDDFAMMREVLRRRLERLKNPKRQGEQEARSGDRASPEPAKQRSMEFSEENSGNDQKLLLLIDGGKGQLSAVREVMEELGLWGEIPVVAIAKGVDRNAGRETFHVPGKPEFQLPIDDPVLHYLQRLRDEAHRYVIGAHRQKRSAVIKKSALDEIKCIGAKRKKALLQHFGSARAVANASVDELAQISGFNQKTAQAVWEQFHR